jgi:uncharacterized integral membrane protein
MSLRTLFLLLLAVLLAIFVALNWRPFTAPTTLSLLFTNVQAPLGLVMLVIACLVASLFLLYIGYLQARVIVETRRHARELHAQRKLADDSETSRLVELRGSLEAGLQNVAEEVRNSRINVQERIDQRATDVRETVEQTGTVLTAYLGEIEDRLEQRIAAMKAASGS